MATDETTAILWLRRDLRLADNPALNAAAEADRVVPVFILDENLLGRPMGAASLWWLDKSLRALGEALKAKGASLILRRGDSEAELRRLVEQTGATRVCWNRLVEPGAAERDGDIRQGLEADGLTVQVFDGLTLARPGTIRTQTGGPYKVYTPFANALWKAAEPPPHTTGPRALTAVSGLASDDIDDWKLHPTRPDWSEGFDWTPGEDGAKAALRRFLDGALGDYADGRDIPGKIGTSRLSPHLHWGEISPWRAIEAARDSEAPAAQAEKFASEIAWREFSAHLLHDFPQMVGKAFRPEYDRMPWRSDAEGLKAWKRGQTGYPIVDAGMRQLWATGWMHNRVRMIVASFLIKDLLIDWREGEAWFWDTLVDADLANNVQNWQWVAGSGADAAPYFRIYNPVTQGEKFDGDGAYVRKWVPELSRLDRRWLHAPWTAPADALERAGVKLDRDYPRPIVDHAEARKRALDALKSVGSSDAED
ncbi:deoxyribodipyrimidine photo-lyase [Brevundimonas sp.]|uniref:cryptochrome/photolyase family protein n=1 Tax=Brevundimonas sp. TaxID=1871086 RepID=UPI0035AD78C8